MCSTRSRLTSTSSQATLHSLSLILSFHASLNSLSVTSYARHAPRALTGQLQLEAGKFDAVCSELEGRIVSPCVVEVMRRLQLTLFRALQTATSHCDAGTGSTKGKRPAHPLG